MKYWQKYYAWSNFYESNGNHNIEHEGVFDAISI